MACHGMLLERISLTGIARVLQIEDTVQRYVNISKWYPSKVEVSAKPKKRLTVQMDELWSFGER